MAKVFLKLGILFAIIATTTVQPSFAFNRSPSGSTMPVSHTRNIYKPTSQNSVYQITDSITPWVLDDLVPIILNFRDNVFQDLKTSPQVYKIRNLTIDSKSTRSVYFKVLNEYLTEIGHPVPAALANIMSKSASLFTSLNTTIFFETDAINFAEFLLSRYQPITRETSIRYVRILSYELSNVDLDDLEAVIRGTLYGYVNFVQSFNFKIIDVINELFELYASEIIVLHAQRC